MTSRLNSGSRRGVAAAVSARAGEWLATPAPPARPAVFRILVGAFTTAYVAIRAPVFLGLTERSRSSFEPVGVLWWLQSPLPDATVTSAVVVLLVAGCAVTVGLFHRVTGPLCAVLALLLMTYRSSWGQLLWFENLLVLHLLIVGFTRAADAYALDARRRQDRPGPSTAYGWPLRIAAVVTVITYVLAGIAKLRIGGLAWLDGDTLRHHVAYSATRLDVLGGASSPLAAPFVRQRWLASPLAVATIAIEIAAPVALLGGRWRTGWVLAAWAFHLGVALVMFVVFPYPLLLIAFAPLFRLECLVGPLAKTLRRAP